MTAEPRARQRAQLTEIIVIAVILVAYAAAVGWPAARHAAQGDIGWGTYVVLGLTLALALRLAWLIRRRTKAAD